MEASRPPPNFRFEVGQVGCAEEKALDLNLYCEARRGVLCVEDQNRDGVPDLFAVTQLDDDGFTESIAAWCVLQSGLDGACLSGPTLLPWPAPWSFLRFEKLLEPLRRPARLPSSFVAVLWERYGEDGLLWRQWDDVTLHARVSPDGALAKLEDPDLARLRATSEADQLDADQALHSIFGRDGSIVVRTARIDGECLALTDSPIRAPWTFHESARWLWPPLWRSETLPFLFAQGPAAIAVKSVESGHQEWSCAPLSLQDAEFLVDVATLGRDARPPLFALATIRNGNHYDSRLFAWDGGPTPPWGVPLDVRRGERIKAAFALPDIDGDGSDELGIVVGVSEHADLRVLDVQKCEELASVRIGKEFYDFPWTPFVFRHGERGCVVHLIHEYGFEGVPYWLRVQVDW